MDRQAILEHLARRPFERLQFTLSSGEVYEVRHPEVAALGKSRLTIVDPKTDRSVTIRLVNVASVRTLTSV